MTQIILGEICDSGVRCRLYAIKRVSNQVLHCLHTCTYIVYAMKNNKMAQTDADLVENCLEDFAKLWLSPSFTSKEGVHSPNVLIGHLKNTIHFSYKHVLPLLLYYHVKYDGRVEIVPP